MAGAHLVPRIRQHPHPIPDEMPFAGRDVVETAGERRSAAPAYPVAHDQDFADLELGHCKLQRGRNAVVAAARFIGRGERGDVAGDEHLARPGVEDFGRIARLSAQARIITCGFCPSASSAQRSRS